MAQLSLLATITHDVLTALIGLFTILLGVWQINVLRGKSMNNPDGSVDDWHVQRAYYGIALADLLVAVPASLTGIILVLVQPVWGVYVLSMVSFWFVWVNVMTTVNSLRFEKPKFTVNWFFIFPAGALVGLAYLVWAVAHFHEIFAIQ